MRTPERKIDKALLAMLFLLLSLLRASTKEQHDPLYILCEDQQNYTSNSPFETNLKFLLNSLYEKASLTGFYNTSTGNDLNQVYGKALCRGDIDSKTCRSCLANANQEIMKRCKLKEAIIWYELCQVHYSPSSNLAMTYSAKDPDWNKRQKNLSEVDHFDEKLKNLMGNLWASTPSKGIFATGKAKYLKKETIYGLVQCTWDISASDCRQCLGNTLNELYACCNFRQAGIFLNRNCNVRFGLSKFYRTTDQGNKWRSWVHAGVATLVIAVSIGSCGIFIRWRTRKINKDVENISQTELLHQLASPAGVRIQQGEFLGFKDLPFVDLAAIKTATNNFSDSNKLGQGGFGVVYKGVLPDGKEIAIKRLSRNSWQGLKEFKNEITLIAKLQHRNLVRLLGCGIEGDEKLLVYEFMPNKSLNYFIFDSEKRSQLNWVIRHDIINGIARGLLYLHEDSRLKIIHRDLKPSNVLLDHDMVAKISDFGMAKIFEGNQTVANTKRVVGTYGYMAPEYAMEGLFSVKSDVFSFGVILLEVISGQRNSGFHLSGHAQTLLSYAWRLWNKGKALEFIDPILTETCPIEEVMRCMHIGLLCVQEDPADRPTMSTVVVLLESKLVDIPQPREPAIFMGRRANQIDPFSTSNASGNEITVSSIYFTAVQTQ